MVATTITKAQDQLPILKGDRSTFKIIDEGAYPNASYIKVSIREQGGMAISGYVSLRDSDDKVVVTFFSDKNGLANLMLYDMKDVKSISIFDIGYHQVNIPISRLRNRTSTIEVRLVGQSTSN